MKVLQVAASLSPEWGGPTTVLRGLTPVLASIGADCDILAAKGRRVGTDLVSLDGARAKLFPTDGWSRFWTGHSRDIAPFLAKNLSDYDLVHVHELWHYPAYAALKAARRQDKPYIVSVHGALEPWVLSEKSLRKRVYMSRVLSSLLEHASYIHAITRAEEEYIRAQGLTAPVEVIPNGVDTPQADGPPAYDERRNGAGPNAEVTVLFLGRLHPKKGLDILAEAFGQIARHRDDVRLIIAGPDEGGYGSAVVEMLRKANVLDKTVLPGMVEGNEKTALLGSADVFVLPSYSEGFSTAVLEAMASGLPVVISRQCYFPEVAEENAGVVIDSNAVQLQEALVQLVDHPGERRVMGDNARQLVLERYTWEEVARRMVELYRKALRR